MRSSIWQSEGNRVLRLELHPRDADFSAVRRSWQRILERALKHRRPSTVTDFMRHARPAEAGTVWMTTTRNY